MPMDDDAPDDEIEIELRPAREVAARAVVLAAVCRRAFLEERPESGDEESPEAERFDLSAWLATEGLDGWATTWERGVLAARVGALEAETAAEASWQTEGLVALGWALGLLPDLPGYDGATDPAPVLAAVPAPWDDPGRFLREARLRDEDAIARERERAEVWDWRTGVTEALGGTDDTGRADAAAAVAEVAAEAHAAGLAPPPVGGDFAVRGRPFEDLTADDRDIVGSVAAQRLRALDWLCGLREWDDPRQTG
jgi:hypothetical protein